MYIAGMTTGLIPGGLLIAVEGIDGAGKTTVAHALARQLREHGVAVSLSKEPTNGTWGAQMRASAAAGRLDAQEEMRLLLLDRREHVDTLVKPALARGEIVILDRYYPSSAAYQGARGIALEQILAQNAFAPAPDLTLLLDLEPEIGLSRIRARGDKPNHFETAENLTRCREIFLRMPLPSRQRLDATQAAASVLAAAWQALRAAAAFKLEHGGLGMAERESALGRLDAAAPA